MRTIGLFEAKNKLSELVEAARAGEEIIITRRGAPVARLSGLEARGYDDSKAHAAAAEMDARRAARAKAGMRLRPGEILEILREGRKY